MTRTNKHLVGLTTFAVVTTMMAGCASVGPVADAEGAAPISGLFLSCKKPYELTQDCNSWSAATRKIEIDGFTIAVGASEDGKTVLVKDANPIGNTIASSPFAPGAPAHTKASNKSYEAVKRVLFENEVRIIEVRPVQSAGSIDGYMLQLDKNGYDVLKELTKTS